MGDEIDRWEVFEDGNRLSPDFIDDLMQIFSTTYSSNRSTSCGNENDVNSPEEGGNHAEQNLEAVKKIFYFFLFFEFD